MNHLEVSTIYRTVSDCFGNEKSRTKMFEEDNIFFLLLIFRLLIFFFFFKIKLEKVCYILRGFVSYWKNIF